MSHLVPCPECSRHVRVSESQCPFCALPLDLAESPEPRLPSERLSRAATLAFNTTRAATVALGALASATALAACGDSVPVYGAPAPVAGAANVAGSAGAADAGATSLGGAAPVYGAPATGGTGNGSSGSSNSGGFGPIYGAAP